MLLDPYHHPRRYPRRPRSAHEGFQAFNEVGCRPKAGTHDRRHESPRRPETTRRPDHPHQQRVLVFDGKRLHPRSAEQKPLDQFRPIRTTCCLLAGNGRSREQDGPGKLPRPVQSQPGVRRQTLTEHDQPTPPPRRPDHLRLRERPQRNELGRNRSPFIQQSNQVTRVRLRTPHARHHNPGFGQLHRARGWRLQHATQQPPHSVDTLLQQGMTPQIARITLAGCCHRGRSTWPRRSDAH